MISKRNLINSLFVLAWPAYGYGMYRAYTGVLSLGFVLCLTPFLIILLVHGIDLIYRTRTVSMVNRVYWIGMAYLISLAGAQWLAFARGFPGFNPTNTMMQTIMFMVPFNASIVVQIRNRDNDDFDFARMLLTGIFLLIVINLMGYATGLRNVIHGLDGRMNLPFLRGVYDAAHLMSIVNLILLFRIKNFVGKPFTFMGLTGFYLLNMFVMIDVNSRLSFMMFLLLTLLFLFRIMKTLRFVFPISLFTMPLLMGSALIIYNILTLPLFSAIVSRVDKDDVTTFNSRTYIWEEAWQWFLHDRRGFFFGNGYNGQYALGMMDRVALIWETDHAYNIHMHSTFLEVVMSQGVVGYVLFCTLVWFAFRYYRELYKRDTIEAPLFAAVVYLMFIWQIDIFCYGLEMGNPLFFALLSSLAIDPKYITRRQKALDGSFLT